MIKKLMAALTVTALVTFGAQAPARAAWSDCGNYPGTICLFANNNWGLPIWRQYPSQIGNCRNLTGFDNVTTMAVNGADGHSLIGYRYLGCEGESLVITSGNYADFTGTWWNDKFSSVQVVAF